jgi:hypothetical protein
MEKPTLKKIYEVKGDSFFILHNQKTFEIKNANGQFEIKKALCDDLKELFYFVNALTDIAEFLSLSPEEKLKMEKEREERQQKSQNIMKEKRPRTFSKSKMTPEEKKEKQKIYNQKRKEQIEKMSPEEKAEALEKRREYMREYKARKQSEKK